MTLLLAAVSLGMAQVSGTPHCQASLLASVVRAAPGQSFLVGFRIKLDPEWHCYWKNPGDSGAATEIKWSAPKGWAVQPLDFPIPHYLLAGGNAIYGYEKEAMFLARVTPPKNATGNGVVKASGDWLVCQEACVPAKAALTLTIPVGPQAQPSATVKRLVVEAANLPAKPAGWNIRAIRIGKTIDLMFYPPAIAYSPWGARFFAADPATIDHDAEQVVGVTKENCCVIRLIQSEYAAKPPTRLRGILVAPEGRNWSSGRAIQIDVPISTNS